MFKEKKMKALLAALALLVGFQAEARSIQISVSHVLPVVEINKKKTDLVGVVNVDLMKETITLSLYQDPCGSLTAEPGTIHCMAVAVLKQSFVAPLQKRQSQSCNTAVYAGKEDRRPVDGPLVAIQLVDNSYNTCEISPAFLAQTTVVQEFVSRMGGKSIKTTVKATAK